MNSSKEEFAHLHIHNEYSLLDGYGTAQQYVERAKQLGMEHLALTNHMNVDGCVRWQQACDEAGIHSILGCEMYLVEDIKYRPPRDKTQRRERTYHITLLARNQDGWKSILHLLTQANLHGFYYRPRIDPSLLLENCSGLIIMSACASSFIQTEWGRGLLEDLVSKSLPVYLEVMPHNYKDQVEVNALALSLAKEYGLPIVATNDCHYVERGQEKLQEVLLAIQRNAKWNDPNRWRFDVTGLYLRTRKEMVEAFTTQGVLKRKEILEALDNTLMAAEQCTLHLERIPVVLPHVPVPGKEGLSDEDKLIELALDGLYEKAEHHKEIGTSIEEYEERLKEELELVIKLGFTRYFLIVWELIRWCKENDIMTGPGRGCFTGDTKVSLLDGSERTFKELAEKFKNKSFWVYSCLPEGKIIPGKARNPRVTKTVDRLCVVRLDNGEEISCTEDHLFLMRDGQYKKACNLVEGDKLMPLYRSYTDKGYEMYYDNSEEKFLFTHHMNFAHRHGFVIHHKDFNRRNNTPENLEQLSNKEHGLLHAETNSERWNVPEWREKAIKRYWRVLGSAENRRKTIERNKSKIHREKVSRGQKRVWSDPAYKEKMVKKLNGAIDLEKKRKMLIERNKSGRYRDAIIRNNKSSAQRKKVSEGRKAYFKTEAGLKERELISKRMAGRVLSDATKRKISKALSGRRLSEEHKKKISISLSKRNSQNYVNHRVVSVSYIDSPSEVYDLEVEKYHNFALSSGVFVHNSVGGSLLAYVLGITKVNPLKYNLLFARFISPARIDLPDIDMDFEDIKRDLIREHLEKLYGKYNVAGVSTFAALHGRGALRDVSRVFSVSPKDVDAAAKSIVVRDVGDVRASFTIEDAFNTFEDGIKFKKKYPEVSRIAMALQGQKVRAGMHAAAICIAGHDLRDALCANLVRRKQGTICVNWDKEDAEFNGLMKLDVLGLKALTILNYCAKLIKERHGVEINFEKIPLDDKEVYDQFTQGNTIGCFQFNTPGMIKLCKEIGIEDFNQLTDLNALHRPGCLRSGMTVDYRLRKHGQQEIPKVHPFIEKLTKDTRGLILYQEQVMNLLYDLGGLPWRTADTVRKVISKSKGVEQFKKFESLFIEGCQKRKTLPPNEAKKVFDELKHFGSYGFNKSHAVEYATIGYWDMWLKVHYPAEFMVAVLTYGTDLKKRDCIMELRRLGLKFILPNVNESKAEEWAINKSGVLVVPLCEIKGIGPAAAKAIEKERLKNGAYKSLDDLQSRLPKRTVNSRVIKTLSAVGALFFKEEDRPQFSEAELERLSEYFSFELSSDPMYRFRKLLRVLKTSLSIRPLNSVNFLRTERESSLYFGRMTQIKFGYREKVQNVITDKVRDIKGTKGALGGVYGNFEDQTDFAMLVFGSKVYQEHKEEIEHCSGRWLLAKANHPYRTSSLHTEEFWFVEDLESANTRGLSLRLAKTLSPRQRRELERLGEAMSACEHCSLRKECSQVVRPSIGNLNACIIGEAPGRQEDRVGEGFVGGGGEVLWTELGKKFNLTREDFYITNVQKCWPSETKTPKPSQIDICSKYWLSRELSIVKPFLVLALGNTVNYFFRQESSGINALSGTVEWSPKYGCWIAWCIHPAAVIYNRAQNYQTFSEGISRWAETLYNLGFA